MSFFFIFHEKVSNGLEYQRRRTHPAQSDLFHSWRADAPRGRMLMSEGDFWRLHRVEQSETNMIKTRG